MVYISPHFWGFGFHYTMAQYSGINSVLDSLQMELRTMKINQLAVFAAPLQCTDEVKVVSRGTPRSRTSVTWGIWWLASAAEKDGERGERFRTVRHEHFWGLIGRSHSPAQSQAEEREGRRRHYWDHGNTIFTSSAERKAQSPRAVGVYTTVFCAKLASPPSKPPPCTFLI